MQILGDGTSTALAGAVAADTAGPRGSALADWEPLYGFLGVFALLLVVLFVRGKRTGRTGLLRIPAVLEDRTGVPGWACTALLFNIYGLAVAGYGFYTDVAWHVALGRDDDLFTAPHTAILVGLVMIAVAPMAGVAVATVDRAPTSLRPLHLRVPWSLVPLAVLGLAALIGFPVDELWHGEYGVDVTMWSPPHLIMILAASLSGLASWMILADAGVRPTDGRWARGLHVVAAALTLQGLSSVQGEFSFGVPQWQQLYHPVLVCLAAGVVLVMIRLVHGPGWALGIAAAIFLFQAGDLLGGGEPIETRAGAVYVGSALVVEIVARIAGTGDRLRLALLSGVGVSTLGLATEWWWNQGAHQPWNAALLPEAVLVGTLAGVSGALVGTGLAGAISHDRGRRRVPAPLLALAVLGVLVALAIPAPRQVGDVTADVSLEWVDADRAIVDVVLEPADAAVGARWFTVGSWQWGDRQIVHMQQVGPGAYTSGDALVMTGRAKALLRLHRGAEMMAVAVRLPADPDYDLPEVPAEDRTTPFVAEQRYLQREAAAPGGWLATAVHALVVVLAAAWLAAVSMAAARIGRRSDEAAPAPLAAGRGSGASVSNRS
jgi:hypothetical protein